MRHPLAYIAATLAGAIAALIFPWYAVWIGSHVDGELAVPGRVLTVGASDLVGGRGSAVRLLAEVTALFSGIAFIAGLAWAAFDLEPAGPIARWTIVVATLASAVGAVLAIFSFPDLAPDATAQWRGPWLGWLGEALASAAGAAALSSFGRRPQDWR